MSLKDEHASGILRSIVVGKVRKKCLRLKVLGQGLNPKYRRRSKVHVHRHLLCNLCFKGIPVKVFTNVATTLLCKAAQLKQYIAVCRCILSKRAFC